MAIKVPLKTINNSRKTLVSNDACHGLFQLKNLEGKVSSDLKSNRQGGVACVVREADSPPTTLHPFSFLCSLFPSISSHRSRGRPAWSCAFKGEGRTCSSTGGRGRMGMDMGGGGVFYCNRVYSVSWSRGWENGCSNISSSQTLLLYVSYCNEEMRSREGEGETGSEGETRTWWEEKLA